MGQQVQRPISAMFKQEAHYQVEKNVMLNMYFKILQIKVKFWKRKLQNHPSYVAKQYVGCISNSCISDM